MPRIDPHGWLLHLSSGLVIIGSTIAIALTLHHGWSWPLFVGGAVFGPIASAYAFLSSKAFARRLGRRNPGDRQGVETRSGMLWSRYRATYAGLVLLGIGVGILASGVHRPAVDVGLFSIWLLVGVLLPLVVLRRILAKMPVVGSAIGDEGQGNTTI
jgi:MFS family permease